MRSFSRGLFLALSTSMIVDAAYAGEPDSYQIRGRRLIVRSPSSEESRRSVLVQAKEKDTDVGVLTGNPAVSGATLRITTIGGTSADQVFQLDASGWKTNSSGFKYSGPTGADGDPVKKVVLKRSSKGSASLQVVLRGQVGTQNLNVVPPNLGTEATITLSIPGGDTYCTSFGGAAGGISYVNTAKEWQVREARNQPPCPAS